MTRIKVSLLTALIVAVALLSPHASYAQEEVALGYAPVSEYLILEPGEVYEGKFSVWNLKEDTNKFYVYARSFTQVQSYPGTAVPLSEEDDAKNPYSASSWITTSIDELDLVPQENFDIYYTIRVPENAALGEYTAKVFLTTDKKLETLEETTSLANLASGPNLLIQIGDISELNEDLDLLRFYSEKKVYGSFPTKFLAEMQNTGDTHVSPVGDIAITNIFGTEVGRVAFNADGLSILRGESATYENLWNNDKMLFNSENELVVGPMKAEVTLQYKSITPGYYPINSETSFWVVPWKLILILLAIIGGIIFALKLKNKDKK